MCGRDRTRGLILFVLHCEQCHIVVPDSVHSGVIAGTAAVESPWAGWRRGPAREGEVDGVGVGVWMGGSQRQTSHRIHRANKAFKLITTAVYLGKVEKGKTLMEKNPFSWLFESCWWLRGQQ